ncbi:MAG TPA: protein kinase [Methylomirabilota bacterium]|nr:protein kinase [Methylomirabilota bacterium]
MPRNGEPTLDPGAPGLQPRGDAWPGPPIAGRYQFGRELATGSTGTLHRARDLEQGAEVAVKLLPPALAMDDAQLRRLRDELAVTRVVARSRASIAAVLDAGRAADGRTFVILEPLEGTSLAALLAGTAPVPPDRALRIALQVADGLEAAHNHGLVHGAVAAEHVLVDARGHVKLVGFEVARVAAAGAHGDGDRDAGLRPTAALAEWADVRGTAALLGALLAARGRPGAGEAPGAGGGPGARSVPRALRRISAAALEPGCRRRSIDMGALVNALWEALDGFPARARPRGGPMDGGPTWALAGAGALALVVLGGATVLGPGGSRRAVPVPGPVVARPTAPAAPAGPTTPATRSPATAPGSRASRAGMMEPPSLPAEPPPAVPAPALDAAAPRPPPPRALAPRAPASPAAANPDETARPAPTPTVRVPPPPRPPDPAPPGREPAATEQPAAPRAPGPVAAPRSTPGPGAQLTPAGPAAADTDGPDPAAVIDWLLQTPGAR